MSTKKYIKVQYDNESLASTYDTDIALYGELVLSRLACVRDCIKRGSLPLALQFIAREADILKREHNMDLESLLVTRVEGKRNVSLLFSLEISSAL